MAYTAHDPDIVYSAVATRLGTSTGKTVFRVEATPDATLPYAVVYPLDDTADLDVAGSLADPHITTLYEFQVTAVGGTAEQAEWMQHKARAALLGWAPDTVTGGPSYGLIEKAGGQGTRRDDGAQPAKFFAVDRFTLFASH